MQRGQKKEELKSQIVLACQKLYDRGLVANHDGNISVRLEDGSYLATPTSFSKGDVGASDILTLDASGKVLDGPHKVFSEIAWHLAIYRARPDVSCVVHGHPPAASAYGLAGREIGIPALPEAIVSLGRHILTSKFFSPLDPELTKTGGELDRELSRVLNQADAFVARGNGAWAVGQDVLQTYYRLELVEHIALQHLNAEKLGGVIGLPTSLVEDLVKKRVRPQTPPEKIAMLSKAPAGPSAPSSAPSQEQIKDIVRRELSRLLKPE